MRRVVTEVPFTSIEVHLQDFGSDEMNRRSLLLCAGCAVLGHAQADRGVTDTLSRPLFLHGPVNFINWADPHPLLELLHRPGARDALRRWEHVAARSGASAGVTKLLSDAIVPPTEEGARWRVEVPSLARLEVAGVQRPKIGDILDVLGWWRSPFMGTPTIAAEVFLAGGRIYELPPVGSKA